MDIVKTRCDDEIIDGLDEYPSYCDFDRKIHIDYASNLKFSCMISYEYVNANFFPLLSINLMSKSFYNSNERQVVENIDSYRDEGMGDVIVGNPFCREIRIKARRFDGMITVYNGNDSVTYQMARSHLRFKHLTNVQCNKMRPLMKVSAHDELKAPPTDPPNTRDGSRQWWIRESHGPAVQDRFEFQSQVKDNKIDLLVQQYEQFTILEEESIDNSFARFNTIITSLKTLDEGFSSKNYVRKFLRALHPKWRIKVTSIEESKDLSSLALDELIGNLKVHKVVMEKDSEIYKGKKEIIKPIALKAKKESSDDETSTSRSDDEEYVMAVRNFKKFFRRKGKFVRQPREEKKSFRQRDEKKGKSDRKCFRCGDPNHLIGDCPKPSRNKDQKAFIGGSWSNSKNDAEDKLTMKLVSWLNRQMR
ncbi:zf-CCHC domain-containing protein [Tanacetum coccineum]|uniref:Zf-CCHC domain-containing protein n=1 Tax=Tanacetum coccineum TaxID=301880 RepID=A0ABQ5J8P4_9ASTR